MDLAEKVKRYGARLSKFPSALVDEKEALRCLDELNKIAMTTTVLEDTKIGRTLNDIRKGSAVMEASALVCKQCKDTIRRWKSLVTSGELPKAPPLNIKPVVPTPSLPTSPPAKSSSKSPHTPSARSLEQRPSKSHGQVSSSSASSQDGTVITNRSNSSPTALTSPATASSAPRKQAGPMARSSSTQQLLSTGKRRAHAPAKIESPSKRPCFDPTTPDTPLSPPKTAYKPQPPPPPQSRDLAKRPAASVLDQRDLDTSIGQRAQNTHTIYSGRRRGGRSLPTLMELSMQVLIDNIDCVEQTYLPYHVISPLLEKASAAQLSRLESFNPQIVDDTGELWKRHCMKDFRTAGPQEGESWKDCYTRTAEEKSNRLQSLTARIKKTSQKQAQEDAKHAAKFTEVTRAPRRRTVASAPSSWQRPATTPFSRAASSTGKPLMQKTMKMMAARRQMNVPAKPLGRR
ncbi:transcription elongation factor B polypeptide 3-like [Sycon ciliatum]|uniref:transcription elongation factor B polypeptide 3-like n=1 Tax=Sycon ciliatum TaxID=27933 RepID=UPI0020A9B006|eukprot:scpid54580/ scgid15516/ Transcription elongation factor B polypeptide 3; Elongin 110 kDa subunit; Elongin-A; RNA polymerase II transcription factor SIII subunit A1; SIII p110